MSCPPVSSSKGVQGCSSLVCVTTQSGSLFRYDAHSLAPFGPVIPSLVGASSSFAVRFRRAVALRHGLVAIGHAPTHRASREVMPEDRKFRESERRRADSAFSILDPLSEDGSTVVEAFFGSNSSAAAAGEKGLGENKLTWRTEDVWGLARLPDQISDADWKERGAKRRIITGSSRLVAWDEETGDMVAEFSGAPKKIHSVAVSDAWGTIFAGGGTSSTGFDVVEFDVERTTVPLDTYGGGYRLRREIRVDERRSLIAVVSGLGIVFYDRRCSYERNLSVSCEVDCCSIHYDVPTGTVVCGLGNGNVRIYEIRKRSKHLNTLELHKDTRDAVYDISHVPSPDRAPLSFRTKARFVSITRKDGMNVAMWNIGGGIIGRESTKMRGNMSTCVLSGSVGKRKKKTSFEDRLAFSLDFARRGMVRLVGSRVWSLVTFRGLISPGI